MQLSEINNSQNLSSSIPPAHNREHRRVVWIISAILAVVVIGAIIYQGIIAGKSGNTNTVPAYDAAQSQSIKNMYAMLQTAAASSPSSPNVNNLPVTTTTTTATKSASGTGSTKTTSSSKNTPTDPKSKEIQAMMTSITEGTNSKVTPTKDSWQTFITSVQQAGAQKQ